MTQRVGEIFERIDDQMDDLILTLKDPSRDDRRGAACDQSKSLPDIHMDHEICCSRFVLDCHKGDSFRRLRTLTQQDQAGDAVTAVWLEHQ